MPNKVKRHKRRDAISRRTHVGNVRKGASVKALLSARAGPALARVSAQVARQKEWRKWLESRLPAELAVHLSGVVERDDTLVVFTESAGWAARVRYAIAEIEGDIRKEWAGIGVVVRVLPVGKHRA